MSDRSEKLATAAAGRPRDGVARCTLQQLGMRWGSVTLPRELKVGGKVVKTTMSGVEEWRVTSIADGKVSLEQVR